MPAALPTASSPHASPPHAITSLASLASLAAQPADQILRLSYESLKAEPRAAIREVSATACHRH